MTRKDYVAIAAAIQGTAHHAALKPGATAIAVKLADMMQRDNPRFDRARFLKACGVQS